MSKKNKSITVALFTKATANDLKSKGFTDRVIEIEATASMAGMAYLAMHYSFAAASADAGQDRDFLQEQSKQLSKMVESERKRLGLLGFGAIATEVVTEIDNATTAGDLATDDLTPTPAATPADDLAPAAATPAADLAPAAATPADDSAPADDLAIPAAPAPKPAKPTAAASIVDPAKLLAAADPALAAFAKSSAAATAKAEAKRLLNEAETSLRAEEVLGNNTMAVSILSDIVDELGLKYDEARLADKAASAAMMSLL